MLAATVEEACKLLEVDFEYAASRDGWPEAFQKTQLETASN
jgi:hypothetical protein